MKSEKKYQREGSQYMENYHYKTYKLTCILYRKEALNKKKIKFLLSVFIRGLKLDVKNKPSK